MFRILGHLSFQEHARTLESVLLENKIIWKKFGSLYAHILGNVNFLPCSQCLYIMGRKLIKLA